eukprot:jgi/Orpsp1_1/1179427/evm.model.c7180000069307.1
MFYKFSKKPFICIGLLSNLLSVNGKTDCDVLTNLYKCFNIENKITWDDNTYSCCNIIGIECIDNRITKIDLQDSQLKGYLSHEITDLTELTILDLRFNEISGTIPENIDSLSKLKILNLGRNNGISGTIPKEICSLKNLSELYLYNNAITGEIPECIGELKNIVELCLDNNRLEGHIPSSIGELSNLKHLDLENNQLTGIIPESFSKLRNVEKINLQGNSGLIGNLPEIHGVMDCLYSNTDLCVKEESNTCSNNLRKCTEDDIKKVEKFKSKYGSNGFSVVTIILIIIPLLLVFIICIFLYRKKTKSNNNKINKSSRKTNEPLQSLNSEKDIVDEDKDDILISITNTKEINQS